MASTPKINVIINVQFGNTIRRHNRARESTTANKITETIVGSESLKFYKLIFSLNSIY